MQELIPILITLLGVATLGFLAWRYLNRKSKVAERLEDDGSGFRVETRSMDGDPAQQGWIKGWLFRAGFRGPNAVIYFWLATFLSAVLAFGLILTVRQQGYFDIAADYVSSIPGGVGNVLVPFVMATPWFLIAVFIMIPTLYVRSVRRRRIQSIERELPLILDLLETLAQAGIGFDSALDRILEVQDPKKPLVVELRGFQIDNLAGRSRIDSLRRLMRRVEVPMFSTFISAIIQAEQSGAAIGTTLKTQSSELRARRRERATAAAMSVPTLLVVPMVIGFLPGIFIILLGPMLYEAFGVMGQTFRGVMGQ